MAFVYDCKVRHSTYINRSEGIIGIYFNDIRRYDELTPNTERELLIKVKASDKRESIKARQKLVECNQRFVSSIARRYSNRYNYCDILQSANIGLMAAIDNFDINGKTNRLLTYAVPWMRKYINEYIIHNEKLIKPINADRMFTYANKIRNKFYAENERMPSLEEIQTIMDEEYHLKVPYKEDLENISLLSIDAPVGDMDNSDTFEELGDFAVNTSENNVQEHINNVDDITKIDSYLSKLNEREEDMLRAYYGIGRMEESVTEISYRYNLTRERVRQIMDEAIKKLQRILIKK